MYSTLTSQFADQRIAELQRQADRQRLLSELRAGRGRSGRRSRRWLRRSAPAPAAYGCAG